MERKDKEYQSNIRQKARFFWRPGIDFWVISNYLYQVDLTRYANIGVYLTFKGRLKQSNAIQPKSAMLRTKSLGRLTCLSERNDYDKFLTDFNRFKW